MNFSLKILKVYLRTRMNLLCQGFQQSEQYRQIDCRTDATDRITTPYSRVVKIKS